MRFFFVSLVFLLPIPMITAAEPGQDPAIGKWDLVVEAAEGAHPSWFEIHKSGNSTLVGAFVGQFGSARPVSHVTNKDGEYRFSVPPQWEERENHLVFEFKVDGDQVSGVTTDKEGKAVSFSGSRAPSLKRDGEPKWGEPIELHNGRDLSGWSAQLEGVENGWVVKEGLLSNDKPGNNIVSTKKFDDFKLHAEFRYPEGSNSGLYLRGRYEVQIEDNFGNEPGSHNIGGVYGYLTPSINAAKKAGEWQTYDITLVGRTVSIILNGERVVDRQRIPGITGGALDSNEGQPGPIMVQGDHGPVEFRKLTVTPAVE